MLFIRVLATGLCAALGTAALAGGEITSSGVAAGPSTSAAHPVGENHVVIDIGSNYEKIEMADSAHPLHGGTGPCFGAVEMSPRGTNGGGVCVLSDPQGDSIVLQWHADATSAEGALTGSWEITSGTGKWDGATGGGSFSSLTDEAAGRVENTFTSEITMP